MAKISIKFDAVWDDDAKVWVATSPLHNITTEATSRDALIARLKVIVPDVLEARGFADRAEAGITIDWLALTPIDHTELALA